MTDWRNLQTLPNLDFTCGFCNKHVGGHQGYAGEHPPRGIYICPRCKMPTVFQSQGKQYPLPIPGDKVEHLPDELENLYNEARSCAAANAPTAAVLTCRKLLMNIAVTQGAAEGKTFMEYVEYLSKEGFVPPNGKGWVDHIRKKGNEANHEIQFMKNSDAKDLIDFSAMLLKFIYEFPNRIPGSPEPDRD